MDGGDEDQEWWVRRAVLALLVVVGLATTVYAVTETRTELSTTASDEDPVEVVTDFLPTDAASEGPLRLGEVLVVGRGGDPVSRPAGTAESFAEAIAAGASHVEAEVVMTQDDQLLVRSDNELSASTDVAERSEFADRETTKVVDGVETTGWFTEDFTLLELRTLRAVEPDPDLRPTSAAYDGDLALIGLDDLLVQLAEANAELDREVGIFVQPRRATYFRGLRLPMERAIAKSIRRARLLNEPERVTITSSDRTLLQRLEDNVGDNVLSGFVVDADSADLLTDDELAGLPDTIDLVAVELDAFPQLDDPQGLPEAVHEAGFAIAIYPISSANAPQGPDSLPGFLGGLRDLGVDVLLSDAPGEVVEVLADLEAEED
ncbi:MAG: glycerophosphoryl diester phosphodiesterase [Nocardioides sp.]|nr:glycerophosphoryl diester phosphodiesterase [Nocardioides sp.]